MKSLSLSHMYCAIISATCILVAMHKRRSTSSHRFAAQNYIWYIYIYANGHFHNLSSVCSGAHQSRTAADGAGGMLKSVHIEWMTNCMSLCGNSTPFKCVCMCVGIFSVRLYFLKKQLSHRIQKTYTHKHTAIPKHVHMSFSIQQDDVEVYTFFLAPLQHIQVCEEGLYDGACKVLNIEISICHLRRSSFAQGRETRHIVAHRGAYRFGFAK